MTVTVAQRNNLILIKLFAIGMVWVLTLAFSYGAPAATEVATIPAPNAVSPAAVGIATFRRLNKGIVVFGEPIPIDPAAIRSQPGFSSARIESLPDATIVILTLPLTETLSVNASMAEWSIRFKRRLKPLKPITPFIRSGHVNFPVAKAGRSVMITDPITGGILLVGTVTDESAVRVQVRGPGYAGLPAWRGIVLRALSDELTLHVIAPGFVLDNNSQVAPLPLGKDAVVPASIAAAGTNRNFGLPNGSVADLRHKLQRAQIGLADAPPLNRLPASLRLARVLLALGMGPEAHGVLQNALRNDPASSGNAQRIELKAVSDILDGHSRAGSILTSLSAGPTPETRFWAGLAGAQEGRNSSAAQALASGVSLLLGYAEPLREELAPQVAEILVAGHQLAAAGKIFQAMPNNARLGLPRAEALEAAHQYKAALTAYRALRRSDDLRVSGIATTRIVLLRYRMRQIDAKTAASALSRKLYSWRGSHHELRTRLALARLRVKAGEWSQALRGLNRAVSLLPEDDHELQAERQLLFNRMISSGAINHLGAVSEIAAIQENEDLVPAGAAGAPILHVLARRLMALDLPGAAAPVLKELIAWTDAGVSRARLGLVLAQVDLQAGNQSGAADALVRTGTSDLPADLIERRGIVAAEIQAQGGNVPLALASLKNLNAKGARELKSKLELAGHHWHSAEVTLQALAAESIPASGMLTPAAEKLVMHLASAASEANDFPELASLRTQYKNRFLPGQNAYLFSTLTTPPLAANAGLSEALKQIAAIERLSTALTALTQTQSPAALRQ